MDENSREGETSERVGNPEDDKRAKEAEDAEPELENSGVKIAPVTATQEVQTDVGPSLQDSGESSNAEEEVVQKTLQVPDDDDDDDDDDAQVCPPPTVNREPREVIQERVRQPPLVEQPRSLRKPVIGPPPSYSFVMKQKSKFSKQRRSITPLNERLLPPAYSGMQRLYPPDQSPGFCTLSSFSDPLWRSHSQPAFCPRCGIIILTTTHSHDSIATHVAALALCLFGCWPCCLIPYCITTCKNTYHYCPICQTFLGSYTPW